MKNFNVFKLSLIAMALVSVQGCKKDDDQDDTTVAPAKDDAVFIINEGSFNSGDGSIDYYSPKSDSLLIDIYSYVNVFPLGDVVQSMTVFNDKGYICVNNSQKMEVVNMADFFQTGTTGGLISPRYFCGVNSAKGFVSDWHSNHIKVIDLNTLAVTDSVPAGTGPEQMLLVNNKVFVTNVGGYDNTLSKQIYDSIITVIDGVTNTVTAGIVAGINPNSIRKDANGKIWVLCGGSAGDDFTAGTADDRLASLVRIDPDNLTVEKTFVFGNAELPVKLNIDGPGTTLYFLRGNDGYSGELFKMNINDAALPVTAMINKKFYGLGIGPKSGDIYGGYSPNFGQSGTMFRYTGTGTQISQKTTGVGPNGFAFY